MTRVTQVSMAQTTLAGLQASLTAVQRLQAQASSGKRIQAPSDAPQGIARSMQLRPQRMADTQYTNNSDFASSRLQIADNAVQQLSAQLRTVRNLVISSQNGALAPDARPALASQIAEIKKTVVNLYNSQYL